MSRDSDLEIHHRREQSQETEWRQQSQELCPVQTDDYVTVVVVEEKPYVTVLSVENPSQEEAEEVLVYRLPGERLGFGLKFDGGLSNNENVAKVIIQSCANDSPASRTKTSWGHLEPGDQILSIDSTPVWEMTRMDCVRILKESNVVLKLGIRRGSGTAPLNKESEAPPIPPRKCHKRKEPGEATAPPQAPQAETYTDLISQENLLIPESESDDTGSSISTVVSRISSAPTTCNSSFSDPRSLNSVDCSSPTTPPANQTFDFDKVLDPFLHLEREFSGTSINESSMFHKLAKASNMLERGSDEMPKPAPRQDRRRPPPPPPPPRSEKPPLSEKPHLPRLIDFVPKDRTDLIAPSPLTPTHLPSVPAPSPASQIPCKPPEDLRLQKDLPADSTPQVVPDSVSEVVDSKMESRGCQTTGDFSPEEYRRQGAARAGTVAAGGGAVPKDPDLRPPRHKQRPPSKGVQTTPSSIDLALATANTITPASPKLKVASYKSETKKHVEPGKSLWKNDERSERSVRDKILMFSNVQQTSSSLAPSMRVKMKCENKSFIQDPFCYVSSRDASRENAMNSSLDKFVHLYPTYPRNQKPENGTGSKQTKANSNVSEAEKLDLPDQRNYDYSSFSSSLSRALSFSGSSKVHNRSHSFCEVGSGSAPLERSIEEQRHSSFLALCEQRRRGMSKLRGLVIPEKVLEVPTVQVDDLPIIKTSGCQIAEELPIETKLDTRFFYFKSECDKSPYPSASWKPEAFDMPKYSPAFKRKSLALHTSSLVSSVASSLNSSREELRSCFTDTPKTFGTCFKSGVNVARNAHSAQGQSEPMSLESITSPSVSDVSFEYVSNSASPSLLTSSVLGEVSDYKPTNENSKTKVEKTRLDEESDNDSAVSSSRSSISPPQSPMARLPTKKENGNAIISPLNRGEFHLKRSLSSDTTTSSSSNASTLTSGGQASCSSCSEGSSSSIDNRRVLKPRSVEAINRKNVLSSAKYSSGSDVKYDLSSSDESQVPQIPREEEAPPYSQDNDASFVLMEKEEKYTIDSCVKDEVENDLQLHSDEEQAASPEERFEVEEIICDEKEKKQSIYNLRSEESDTQDICDASNNKDENVEIVSKGSKSESFCEKLEKQNNETVTTSKVSDTAIVKKDLELVEGGNSSSQRYKLNGGCGYLHPSSSFTSVQHPRISSVDSTNSDDSCVPNPLTSNLQREQFGSITSLASSTSLISQQELQQLIEEANHTLEDEGNSQEVIVVILHRDIPGGSIGITLAGGADYEAKEITVHKVLTGSPAERDGRIQKGDRILSINGKSMKGLTHYESLAILKAPRPEVVLVISRQVGGEPGEEAGQPRTVRTREPRFQPIPNRGSVREEKWGPPVLVTVKKDGTGLGFSLDGGKDSPYGDLPLTIKKIFTGGCADKCGELFAGDELVTVNNLDLSQLSRIEAWAMLKKLPNGDVRLNIRRPIN